MAEFELSGNPQNLLYTPERLNPLNEDDQVEASPDLGFDNRQCKVRTSAHGERGESQDGFFGAARMDGGHSASVTRIHCVQESTSFGTAHLPNDDAVRTMA